MLFAHLHPADLMALISIHPDAYRFLEERSHVNEIRDLYREYHTAGTLPERREWIKSRLQDRQRMAHAFNRPDPIATIIGPDYTL